MEPAWVVYVSSKTKGVAIRMCTKVPTWNGLYYSRTMLTVI